MQEHRRLLVYLPPGYDPRKQYPLAIFLHGAAQDEQFFLQALAIPFDKAISCGQLPPVIIAVPDGSIRGRAGLIDVASFWADSNAGKFEQYLMRDVWDHMHRNYPIRAGRQSHALIGVSMGRLRGHDPGHQAPRPRAHGPGRLAAAQRALHRLPRRVPHPVRP